MEDTSKKDGIVIPFGWKRLVDLDSGPLTSRVTYVSPSGTILSSIAEVCQYLENNTTCKCGLQCPIHVPKVFSFNPQVRSLRLTRKLWAGQDSVAHSKSCAHWKAIRRKYLTKKKKTSAVKATQEPPPKLLIIRKGGRLTSVIPDKKLPATGEFKKEKSTRPRKLPKAVTTTAATSIVSTSAGSPPIKSPLFETSTASKVSPSTNGAKSKSEFKLQWIKADDESSHNDAESGNEMCFSPDFKKSPPISLPRSLLSSITSPTSTLHGIGKSVNSILSRPLFSPPSSGSAIPGLAMGIEPVHRFGMSAFPGSDFLAKTRTGFGENSANQQLSMHHQSQGDRPGYSQIMMKPERDSQNIQMPYPVPDMPAFTNSGGIRPSVMQDAQRFWQNRAPGATTGTRKPMPGMMWRGLGPNHPHSYAGGMTGTGMGQRAQLPALPETSPAGPGTPQHFPMGSPPPSNMASPYNYANVGQVQVGTSPGQVSPFSNRSHSRSSSVGTPTPSPLQPGQWQNCRAGFPNDPSRPQSHSSGTATPRPSASPSPMQWGATNQTRMPFMPPGAKSMDGGQSPMSPFSPSRHNFHPQQGFTRFPQNIPRPLFSPPHHAHMQMQDSGRPNSNHQQPFGTNHPNAVQQRLAQFSPTGQHRGVRLSHQDLSCGGITTQLPRVQHNAGIPRMGPRHRAGPVHHQEHARGQMMTDYPLPTLSNATRIARLPTQGGGFCQGMPMQEQWRFYQPGTLPPQNRLLRPTLQPGQFFDGTVRPGQALMRHTRPRMPASSSAGPKPKKPRKRRSTKNATTTSTRTPVQTQSFVSTEFSDFFGQPYTTSSSHEQTVVHTQPFMLSPGPDPGNKIPAPTLVMPPELEIPQTSQAVLTLGGNALATTSVSPVTPALRSPEPEVLTKTRSSSSEDGGSLVSKEAPVQRPERRVTTPPLPLLSPTELDEGNHFTDFSDHDQSVFDFDDGSFAKRPKFDNQPMSTMSLAHQDEPKKGVPHGRPEAMQTPPIPTSAADKISTATSVTNNFSTTTQSSNVKMKPPVSCAILAPFTTGFSHTSSQRPSSRQKSLPSLPATDIPLMSCHFTEVTRACFKQPLVSARPTTAAAHTRLVSSSGKVFHVPARLNAAPKMQRRFSAIGHTANRSSSWNARETRRRYLSDPYPSSGNMSSKEHHRPYSCTNMEFAARPSADKSQAGQIPGNDPRFLLGPHSLTPVGSAGNGTPPARHMQEDTSLSESKGPQEIYSLPHSKADVATHRSTKPSGASNPGRAVCAEDGDSHRKASCLLSSNPQDPSGRSTSPTQSSNFTDPPKSAPNLTPMTICSSASSLHVSSSVATISQAQKPPSSAFQNLAELSRSDNFASATGPLCPKQKKTDEGDMPQHPTSAIAGPPSRSPPTCSLGSITAAAPHVQAVVTSSTAVSSNESSVLLGECSADTTTYKSALLTSQPPPETAAPDSHVSHTCKENVEEKSCPEGALVQEELTEHSKEVSSTIPTTPVMVEPSKTTSDNESRSTDSDIQYSNAGDRSLVATSKDGDTHPEAVISQTPDATTPHKDSNMQTNEYMSESSSYANTSESSEVANSLPVASEPNCLPATFEDDAAPVAVTEHACMSEATVLDSVPCLPADDPQSGQSEEITDTLTTEEKHSKDDEDATVLTVPSTTEQASVSEEASTLIVNPVEAASPKADSQKIGEAEVDTASQDLVKISMPAQCENTKCVEHPENIPADSKTELSESTVKSHLHTGEGEPEGEGGKTNPESVEKLCQGDVPSARDADAASGQSLSESCSNINLSPTPASDAISSEERDKQSPAECAPLEKENPPNSATEKTETVLQEPNDAVAENVSTNSPSGQPIDVKEAISDSGVIEDKDLPAKADDIPGDLKCLIRTTTPPYADLDMEGGTVTAAECETVTASAENSEEISDMEQESPQEKLSHPSVDLITEGDSSSKKTTETTGMEDVEKNHSEIKSDGAEERETEKFPSTKPNCEPAETKSCENAEELSGSNAIKLASLCPNPNKQHSSRRTADPPVAASSLGLPPDLSNTVIRQLSSYNTLLKNLLQAGVGSMDPSVLGCDVQKLDGQQAKVLAMLSNPQLRMMSSSGSVNPAALLFQGSAFADNSDKATGHAPGNSSNSAEGSEDKGPRTQEVKSSKQYPSDSDESSSYSSDNQRSKARQLRNYAGPPPQDTGEAELKVEENAESTAAPVSSSDVADCRVTTLIQSGAESPQVPSTSGMSDHSGGGHRSTPSPLHKVDQPTSPLGLQVPIVSSSVRGTQGETDEDIDLCDKAVKPDTSKEKCLTDEVSTSQIVHESPVAAESLDPTPAKTAGNEAGAVCQVEPRRGRSRTAIKQSVKRPGTPTTPEKTPKRAAAGSSASTSSHRFSQRSERPTKVVKSGDLIWGQMRGFPSWPGKVVKPAEVRGIQQRTPLPDGKVWVKWFGDHTFAQMNPADLRTMTEGLEAHHRSRKKGRTRNRKISIHLETAIQEAVDELEHQQDQKQKKSHGAIPSSATSNVQIPQPIAESPEPSKQRSRGRKRKVT